MRKTDRHTGDSSPLTLLQKGTSKRNHRGFAKLSFFLLIILVLSGCRGETSYTPKPRMYPRVEFPQQSYQLFESDCPFSFEFPRYAEIERDSTFFGERNDKPCWMDINLPDFEGKIHCSYYAIDTENTFDKLKRDAFKLAQEHSVKADAIDEYPIQKPNGVSGFVFDIEGPAASSFQFFMTDSTKHFLRGAVYFDTQTKPDSLKPITEFVKVDVVHLINTFEWK